jgi:hypothetical protein
VKQTDKIRHDIPRSTFIRRTIEQYVPSHLLLVP